MEYYANEQKKSQRISHKLSKNSDLQQIGADSHVRSESRRASVNIPTTTERLLRHRQKLQIDILPNAPNAQATARSYQTLFETSPTQRAQAASAFEKRRKSLVQLISNNFDGASLKTTLPAYESSTHRSTIPAYDHNSLKEMQVAAETASFAQNQNRQFLQDYNAKNLRPYPVYTPNVPQKTFKSKSNPTLTTLYDIQSKQMSQYLQEATTKRQTLVPYTKSYASTFNERREPYTRPGVSLLRDFLEKEKNKSISATTEKIVAATARSDKFGSAVNSERKVTIETKDSFESATKIPQTTRDDKTETASSDSEVYSNLKPTAEDTTEASYKERRDRLMRKLNFDVTETTEPTVSTIPTDKYFGDQPNRPGLIVPPSLTPKSLHSLAIYYATALDNLSTTPTPEEVETTTTAIDEDEPIDQNLPALFSRQTITKYGNLFGHGSSNSELLEEIKLDPNGTYNELAEDLAAQMSQGPLATSPQIRELAQVFTHALSAYLQDPVQFRKVLSDIRPTYPSFADMLTTNEDFSNTEPTTMVNEEDDEILGFSDDHREHDSENSIRGSKALNLESNYPTTVEDTTTTTKPTIEPISTYSPKTYSTTTYRNPFRCCGRISASYTTAPTPRDVYSTLYPYTNTAAVKVNSLIINNNDVTPSSDSVTSFKQGSSRNNNNIYSFGKTFSTDVTHFNDYSEVTTVPTAWGVDIVESTLSPITNSHQMFESKKLRATTYAPETTPVHFTEADSVELENEEELQRAHSQSFVSPKNNNLRQGKQLKQENKSVKKPSEDLEVPTQFTLDTTTTTVHITTEPTTTVKDQTEGLSTVTPLTSSIFTSPDSDKYTSNFQWQTTFGNWQSTILDPITLNDGLSHTDREQNISGKTQEPSEWSNTATTPTIFPTTSEPAASSTINVEVTTSTDNDNQNVRYGKLLRDTTSTEPALDLSTVTDTIVEKAKEIMEGMNATTTQKLMNVMKKTKSKTVKRLILLLVQTCDDDHNSTAEASKRALLEALMAVSQKDMEEIAKEEDLTEAPSTISDIEIVKTTEIQRRMDRMPVQRHGKKLNIDAEAINALSNPTTTESLKTDETTEFTTISTIRTTQPGRRGGRKFASRTTEAEQSRTTVTDRPVAEARVAPQGDLKVQSDTRALELLRSLYTIAARWG